MLLKMMQFWQFDPVRYVEQIPIFEIAEGCYHLQVEQRGDTRRYIHHLTTHLLLYRWRLPLLQTIVHEESKAG